MVAYRYLSREFEGSKKTVQENHFVHKSEDCDDSQQSKRSKWIAKVVQELTKRWRECFDNTEHLIDPIAVNDLQNVYCINLDL